jgi:hypothetical protein
MRIIVHDSASVPAALAFREQRDRPKARVEQYMLRREPGSFSTENYVSTPPALLVVEEDGTVWTLGSNQVMGPRGEYGFDVLRNGAWTGEWASRIERRAGVVSIFTADGRKNWNGNAFI